MPDGTYIPTLQFQPYVDTSTPDQPVQEMDNLGKMLNQRYDTNIAQFDKLDELGHQIQVSSADQYLKQGLLDDTRDAISGIVKNGDWENANAPIREIARRFANDPVITKAAANYQKAQQFKDELTKAELAGNPQIQFKNFDNFSTVDANGNLQDVDTTGAAEKRLDYESKMNQMFEGIHASGSSSTVTSPERDDVTGQIYNTTRGGSSEAITKNKILDVANKNFPAYLASSEGQQRLKVLTSVNSDNPTAYDHATALNLMKQELVNAGLNKVYSENSSVSSDKLAPGQKGKPTLGDGTTPVADISYQQNQNLDDLIKSVDNKVKGINQTPIPKATISDLNPSQVGNPQSDKEVELLQAMTNAKYNTLPQGMSDIYKNLNEVYSGIKDPVKRNQAIKDYLVSIKNSKIQPVIAAYSDPKVIDAENKFFKNGMYEGATFFDPKTNKQLSWEDIKNNYKNDSGNKISDKDIDDSKVIGQYSPDNPIYDMTGQDAKFATARKVNIGGNDFVMGATKADQSTGDYDLNNTMAKITSVRRTGLPISLSHGLKILPGPNDGYLIQQGSEAPRGTTDGKALSIDDLMSLIVKHGISLNKE